MPALHDFYHLAYTSFIRNLLYIYKQSYFICVKNLATIWKLGNSQLLAY